MSAPETSLMRNAVLLVLPLAALAVFVGWTWQREERLRRDAVSRATQTDVRFKLAPPLTLRAFSDDEAYRRQLNLDTLRLTFRASLQEEVEASLREAIEKGTLLVPTPEREEPGSPVSTDDGQPPPK